MRASSSRRARTPRCTSGRWPSSTDPPPSYGDVVRLILSKLPKVPRYRQRVRPVPLQLGRPLWVDDPHFQILYHVRHTAVPESGQRRAAAQPGRPRARPAPGHGQAAVGAVAGRGPGRRPVGDHLQGPPLHGRRRRRHRPDAADVRPRPRRHARRPAGLDAAARPVLAVRDDRRGHRRGDPPGASSCPRCRPSAPPSAPRRASPGRARPWPGPCRRWRSRPSRRPPGRSTARSGRTAAGPGPTASSRSSRRCGRRSAAPSTTSSSPRSPRGFRDLLQGRGELSSEKLVVRSMVPVSVRRPNQKGSLNNQVSAVFVDLPVGLADPVDRLASIRGPDGRVQEGHAGRRRPTRSSRWATSSRRPCCRSASGRRCRPGRCGARR